MALELRIMVTLGVGNPGRSNGFWECSFSLFDQGIDYTGKFSLWVLFKLHTNYLHTCCTLINVYLKWFGATVERR